ncbi:MAG: arylesterase [Gammaproteobacteria bacterium]
MVVTPRVGLAEAQQPGDAARRVLLVLGDSLSAAHNIPAESGWVSLLAEALREEGAGWRVVNASISGETTSGGLSRLPDLLDAHRPSAVIVELGANDGLRGTPLPVIEQQLGDLVAQVQRTGARVIVAGIHLPPNYGKRYSARFHSIFQRVAGEAGAGFIPFLLAGVATEAQLMQSDGLHPTAEAQPLIRDTVLEVLRRTLKGE